MSEETIEERQNNEFEALMAIFGNDVSDNHPPIAWKIWRPLDLLLTLIPLHSSSADGSHCSVTLHIKCCNNYPNKAPQLSISKLRGLSNDNGSKLIEELNQLASTLVGEVMIFNLANHVQNFLHIHNQPATKSFYDEMVQRNSEKEQLKIHDQKTKENEERLAMNIEIERRQALLKADSPEDAAKLKDDKEENGQLVFYSAAKTSSPTSKRYLREPSTEVKCSCVTKGIEVLRFFGRGARKVHIGKCIGHSATGATTFAGIDNDTGELIVVRKWSLPAPKDLQARNRQMNAIEQDVSRLSWVKHANIVPYTSIEIQHEISDRTRSNYTAVYLLRDFVRGSSLRDLRANLNLVATTLEPLSFVRVLAKGIFAALSELHSLGFHHGDIRSENVFLNTDGTVKLVGVCLDVRLTYMWEEFDDNMLSYSNDQDIYSTAQLLLSLITDGFTKHHEIPSHLPSDAKHFFSRCLTEEKGHQWSASKLLEHEFLQIPATNQSQARSSLAEEIDEMPNSLLSSVLSSNGASRLETEFEILKWLGRGAFGDVIKVRNKLDGGVYAIKRIALNPEKVQVNKAITREVTLLSRLSHENVVRYYNAWIETAYTEEESPDRSESITITEESHDKPIAPNNMADLSACVARLAPGGVTLQWSMTDLPRDNKPPSDQDDDNEDDVWFRFGFESSASSEEDSFVQFEMCETDEHTTQSQSETSTSTTQEPRQDKQEQIAHMKQTLYIQMEFCERNTLRQAIDNGLYLEKIRAWRLFREVVEGLAHVHQRGMIHRDLKPMNIFIDSNDNVKIGDFGLATKVLTGLHVAPEEKNTEDVAGSMTGQVGTALYVAPELLQAANKVIYNQKVDIYSLGIILFEMFHPPLNTAMERMKVLNDLRSKEIIIPKSFLTEENTKQIQVIRWLVSHDPIARPTCSEILVSALIPRAFAADTLAGLLAHALANKHSKPHTRLISACMDQTFTVPEDLTYDSGVKLKHDFILDAVRDVVVSVFKSHGAVEFSPPLLMPKIEKPRPFGARLMTSSGGVVHLPHDLRYPFARYVAYSDVRSIRRYCVDKVFRERKATGFHPREMAACAFDVCAPITTATGIWLDAELIAIVHTITKKLGLQVSYQITHRDILDCVLESSGVPKDKYNDIYPVLAELATGRIGKMQLQTHLSSLCLAARDTAALLRLLETRAPLHQAASILSGLKCMKRVISRALLQLSDLDAALKSLGVDCELVVVPCLAANAAQHDGIFWHARAIQGERASRATDLLAVGGRYGSLLDEFFEISKGKSYERKITAVGLTMNLERIANKLRRERLEPASEDNQRLLEPIRVAVCFRPGEKIAGNNAASNITKSLWLAEIPTVILESSNCEEAHETLNANVTLAPADLQSNSVAMTHWDDRCGSVTENRLNVRNAVASVIDVIRRRGSSESKTSETSTQPAQQTRTTSESANINFFFVTDEGEKMTGVNRRRREAQAYNIVRSWCHRAGFRGRVACICVSLPLAPLAALASRPHADVLQQYSRARRLLEEVIEAMNTSVSNRGDEPTLQCLFSLEDSRFAVVT